MLDSKFAVKRRQHENNAKHTLHARCALAAERKLAHNPHSPHSNSRQLPIPQLLGVDSS